jgi:hypothetical protein
MTSNENVTFYNLQIYIRKSRGLYTLEYRKIHKRENESRYESTKLELEAHYQGKFHEVISHKQLHLTNPGIYFNIHILT